MNDIAQSLGKVSEIWLDARHPLREETVQALQVSTGLSRRQIELALANCFEELTTQKLKAFLKSSSPSASVVPSTYGHEERDRQIPRGMTNGEVLHVLPSNAFTAWVHGAVITLLLERRCLLKPSSREPVFARAWQKSLTEVDPDLSEKVEIVSWEADRLSSCGAVVAYGSDDTLQAIRSKLPSGIRFAGHGHKLSVGIIFEEALADGLSEELLERVRADAEPFRLQGCLSPQILYIESAHPLRWPALKATLDVPPKIRPFAEWEDLRQKLAKFSPYLSCVGYAGRPEKEQFLENELWDLKISRVCPLGQMQRPPLSWRNGGIFLPDLLN